MLDIAAASRADAFLAARVESNQYLRHHHPRNVALAATRSSAGVDILLLHSSGGAVGASGLFADPCSFERQGQLLDGWTWSFNRYQLRAGSMA